MNHAFIEWLNSTMQIIQQQEAEQEKRGDRYNIFKVIHMTSNETSVHSAFIADLLNPKGLHGMGNIFLRLFIETIDTRGFAFDIEKCKVETEMDIGPRTQTTGGRLDIIVTNNIGQTIILENKIYAGDGDSQMLRYWNFAKINYHKKYLLLYLSLDGLVHNIEKTTKAIDESGKVVSIAINKDFYTISYEKDILNWLEKCRQVVVEKPLLREGISHYINLIKSLTGNTMDEQTIKELVAKVLSNKENIKYLNDYQIILRQAKKELIISFWKELYKGLCEKYNCLYIVTAEKDNVLKQSSNSIEQVAQKFKLKSEEKGYEYKFGIATPIVEKDDQQLMAGIIIHGAISFRIYGRKKDGEIIKYDELHRDFKNINHSDFPEATGWPSDLYVCVRRPNNGSKGWYFREMNNEVLVTLSEMDDSIKSLLQDFAKYIEEVKNQI